MHNLGRASGERLARNDGEVGSIDLTLSPTLQEPTFFSGANNFFWGFSLPTLSSQSEKEEEVAPLTLPPGKKVSLALTLFLSLCLSSLLHLMSSQCL